MYYDIEKIKQYMTSKGFKIIDNPHMYQFIHTEYGSFSCPKDTSRPYATKDISMLIVELSDAMGISQREIFKLF